MKTKFILIFLTFVIFESIFLIFNSKAIAQNIKPELVVQMGHTGSVESVAFSPDGKYVLSGSGDNTLKLWDISTGKEIRTFEGHKDYVYSVTFSPDGKNALSGSGDNTLKLWDISTGKEIRTFEGHTKSINSGTFSPDGKYALSGSWDSTLKLWDISTGKEIRTFEGHTSIVLSVSFSPDGRYALSGSWDETLKLWDIYTGKEIRTFEGHTSIVLSVSFSPDGKYALSGSGDNTLKLWDISTGKEIRTFQGHTSIVSSVSFSPDGKYALSGSWDNTLKLWDIYTGKEIRTFEGHSSNVTSVTFSPDGKYAISGSCKTLKLWDIYIGKEIRTFEGHEYYVTSVSFSPDGKYALSGNGNVFEEKDNILKLWDIESGKEIRTFEGHKDRVNSVSFSLDGKYALSGSLDNTLKLWDISTGKEISAFEGHTWYVESVSFSPDGKYALSGSGDGTLILWDISTDKEIRTFEGHASVVTSVSFSPDGKFALSGSWDNTLKLWDIETGKEIRTLQGHKNIVNSVSFSPDGKYAISGSWDETLKLWDIETGKEIRTFEGHTSTVSSVSFTSDGNYALSGSLDNTLKLWDISTGKEIRTFEGHKDGVNSVSFSPDAKYALSESWDNTLKLWDISTGKELVSLINYGKKDYLYITPDNFYLCSKGGINAVAFVIGNDVYPPEQFDLQYNRPDIVLERIGLADPELIKAYREAYYKRLEKMKFDTSWFKEDFYMPEIEIENKDELYNSETDSRSVKLDISAKDEKDNNLDRINVFVNGVPIYGTNGIDLRDRQIKTFKEKIEIPLNDSLNKIEVSVLNSAGVESLKDNVEVIYKGKDSPVKPTVYFLGIGVSNYQDANFNLNYAAKDIRDLNDAFEQQYQKNSTSEYKILDTLINERATRENILNLREKLMKTKVDDEVVIYLSGHGLLSKNNDFYYASYNMNFHEPEKYGLMYDDLDKLLDSIPARKKVLFIDACNSGEVEKSINNEELKFKNKIDSVKNDVENIKKGFEPESYKELQGKSKLGLSNSFQLMQEIFVNLSRGNGAVVISAARGYESAFESKSFGNGNGAFTACILEGLKDKKADLNNDKKITISELKEYVLKRVEELTSGMQKPTSRQENLVYDFRIW